MTAIREPMRVLVTDDDTLFAQLTRRVLEEAGFVVDEAHSGAEAVERVRAEVPDCILMDIRMPGMDGIEAYRVIKRQWPQCIVLFVTGYGVSSLAEEARRPGKPVTMFGEPEATVRAARRVAETAASGALAVAAPALGGALSEALTGRGIEVHRVADVDAAIVGFDPQSRRVVILEAGLAEGAVVIIHQLTPGVLSWLLGASKDHLPVAGNGMTTASAYLTKPVDYDALAALIRDRVERRRGARPGARGSWPGGRP